MAVAMAVAMVAMVGLTEIHWPDSTKFVMVHSSVWVFGALASSFKNADTSALDF